ncbi:uncharacterized protein AB675_11315 [Cyphellophora attinorum]|uniref:Uncharacterized protein n=1 Tax=Cyphellophora attinorum TaxID=1664694 RepID=A0A0N1H454_9EURO|nr:uncharacterized protein AB675_11315 [Phialophora attinorum]KPI39913.1 hypothetical protein AB675_11315 [Phialophora attinorum]
MPEYKYGPVEVTHESNNSVIEQPGPTPLPAVRWAASGSKRPIDVLDVFAVLVSFACLAVGVAAISPNLSLAWRLGFANQLILVGFLLSIMSLCFNHIAPTAFLRFEARFGKSWLQNYDAILRNQLFQSHSSLVWRLLILLSLCLPLGLSVAYKRFIGGKSDHYIHDTEGMYGMAAPPGIQQVGITGLSLMANATLPLFLYWRTADSPPPLPPLPQPFGFNLVLLSKTASAVLDAPEPDYVQALRGKLSAGEELRIEADVRGTVTTIDSEFDGAQTDPSFWEPYELGSASLYGRGYISLFHDLWGVELVAYMSTTFAAVVRGSEDDSTVFHEQALKFDTFRKQCRGTWSVTASTVVLLNGSCSDEALPQVSQRIFTNTIPAFATWYMPTLADYLGIFTENYTDTERYIDTEWAMPSFTTIVAAMYWSRMSWLNWNADPYFAHQNQDYDETHYNVVDSIISIKPTLRATWPLYLVLAVYPLLTSLLMLAILLLRKVPIGKNFGTLAILTGVDGEDLGSLKRRTVSGEVKAPVMLEVVRGNYKPDR